MAQLQLMPRIPMFQTQAQFTGIGDEACSNTGLEGGQDPYMKEWLEA